MDVKIKSINRSCSARDGASNFNRLIIMKWIYLSKKKIRSKSTAFKLIIKILNGQAMKNM